MTSRRHGAYSDLIHGDWFNPKGREHHTGAVYLNGEWLTEAAKLDDVLKPAGDTPLWFGQVDKEHTTIWAQFKGVNPNEQLVEINVRRTVFYPDKPGINYITVRGFILRHAATPWAPPTAEQVGLIGTHWSKGWIIENNVISHSVCSGIALGKYGDSGTTRRPNRPKATSRPSSAPSKNGWNKETIGHHIVRNNTISHCEQAGIVGSLGAVFSTVTGNTSTTSTSGGCSPAPRWRASSSTPPSTSRSAAITSTGPMPGALAGLDGPGHARVRQPVPRQPEQDLFVEVDHGPFLVDNNIFLSPTALLDVSQGGAYVHNLIAGRLASNALRRPADPVPQAALHRSRRAARQSVRRRPLSTTICSCEPATWPLRRRANCRVWMDGNVFLEGRQAVQARERIRSVKPEFDPALKLVEKTGRHLPRNHASTRRGPSDARASW